MATENHVEDGENSPLSLLWNHLLSLPNDVVYFVQDRDGIYQLASRGLSLSLPGAKVEGLNDLRVFSADPAAQLDRLHQWVISNRRPIIDVLLNVGQEESARWCLLSKYPVSSAPTAPIERTVGYFKFLRIPVEIQGQLEDIARALESFRNNIAQPHTLEDLAQIAGMGSVKFDRRVQRVLGCSTREYMIRVRMEYAKAMFRDLEREISAIARECGYGNASSFARQFKNWSGMTPSDFEPTKLAPPDNPLATVWHRLQACGRVHLAWRPRVKRSSQS